MVGWCRTMHADITWPRRGQYQCRTCGRHFTVPWVEQEQLNAAPPALHVAPAFGQARTA